MARTKIEWCDFTWNPVIGCTGSCPFCYARKMAHRFHMGRPDFKPMWIEKNFQRSFPKKPSRIFVNSMSDVADWEREWFDKVAYRVSEYPEHLFIFLSKRPWESRWIDFPNAMLGYSVTCQDDLDRLAKHGQRAVSFFSIEPILGPVDLSLAWQLIWIIVGAETGNRKERVIPRITWLRDIHEYARSNNIPLFFKDSLWNIWNGEFPRGYPDHE